jgi:hypothetical protein
MRRSLCEAAQDAYFGPREGSKTTKEIAVEWVSITRLGGEANPGYVSVKVRIKGVDVEIITGGLDGSFSHCCHAEGILKKYNKVKGK